MVHNDIVLSLNWITMLYSYIGMALHPKSNLTISTHCKINVNDFSCL